MEGDRLLQCLWLSWWNCFLCSLPQPSGTPFQHKTWESTEVYWGQIYLQWPNMAPLALRVNIRAIVWRRWPVWAVRSNGSARIPCHTCAEALARGSERGDYAKRTAILVFLILHLQDIVFFTWNFAHRLFYAKAAFLEEEILLGDRWMIIFPSDKRQMKHFPLR